ncbi:MAG: glycosyltransferase [Anaerolineae bacterium]
MRIVMIATGSRGDVEPYIALGVGLRGARYEVRVLTHEDLAPLASARPARTAQSCKRSDPAPLLPCCLARRQS